MLTKISSSSIFNLINRGLYFAPQSMIHRCVRLFKQDGRAKEEINCHYVTDTQKQGIVSSCDENWPLSSWFRGILGALCYSGVITGRGVMKRGLTEGVSVGDWKYGAIANFSTQSPPVGPKYNTIAEEQKQTQVVKKSESKFTYGVCVDGSEHGAVAFLHILSSMNKETERMLIIGADYPNRNLPEEHAHIEKRQLLMKYARYAHSLGVDNETLLLIANNIGEAICFSVKYKHVDLLVMGQGSRKGIQAVLGTISKYCSDNADCNVMFVKRTMKSALSLSSLLTFSSYSVEMGRWEKTHEQVLSDKLTPISIYEIQKENTEEEL